MIGRVYDRADSAALSTSMAAVDRTGKTNSTVRRSIMPEPTSRAATVFDRVDDDWDGFVRSGDTVPATPESGNELPVPELGEDAGQSAEF